MGYLQGHLHYFDARPMMIWCAKTVEESVGVHLRVTAPLRLGKMPVEGEAI